MQKRPWNLFIGVRRSLARVALLLLAFLLTMGAAMIFGSASMAQTQKEKENQAVAKFGAKSERLRLLLVGVQHASCADLKKWQAVIASENAILAREKSGYWEYSRGGLLQALHELERRCEPTETAAALTFFAEVELGGSATKTTPQLFEPFSIASSGFVGGGSLGAQVPIRGLLPGLSIGVRGSVLGFSNSGSAVFHPTDERFTAGLNSMETIDARVGVSVPAFMSGPGLSVYEILYTDPYSLDIADVPTVSAFAGGALGQATVASPVASVDKTLSGHSYGVGIQVPASLFLKPTGGGPMRGPMIGFQWRHYDISGNVLLFGPGSDPIHVNQHGNIFTGTFTVPISDDIWSSISRVQRNFYP